MYQTNLNSYYSFQQAQFRFFSHLKFINNALPKPIFWKVLSLPFCPIQDVIMEHLQNITTLAHLCFLIILFNIILYPFIVILFYILHLFNSFCFVLVQELTDVYFSLCCGETFLNRLIWVTTSTNWLCLYKQTLP